MATVKAVEMRRLVAVKICSDFRFATLWNAVGFFSPNRVGIVCRAFGRQKKNPLLFVEKKRLERMEAGIAETERSIQSVKVRAEPGLDMPRYSIFCSRAYLAMSKISRPTKDLFFVLRSVRLDLCVWNVKMSTEHSGECTQSWFETAVKWKIQLFPVRWGLVYFHLNKKFIPVQTVRSGACFNWV